ncbi:lysozyme inhibitor LprI family protein [Methylobacterium marchantiae]|uniref:Lysozyme inhibitor LprI family protein n=1 Tax=Methylobacterium marchantiae TaxID=600331 RepID=A0ABW3X591_9HYPH|nr:hypothetical protein AIGOOFII_4199 [Methylobacterium marchantiae]
MSLNAAYRKALAVIDQDDRGEDAKAKAAWKAPLTAAQRAWIAFRDVDCGDLVLSEWNNGSGATVTGYACRYDKTVQRRDEILSRYPLCIDALTSPATPLFSAGAAIRADVRRGP